MRALSIILLSALLSPFLSAAEEVNFQDHILPILEDQCAQCHNPDKTKGGADVSSFQALLDGCSSGDMVVAGHPEDSILYQVVAHLEEPFMPKKADKLDDASIALIRDWIQQGLREKSDSRVRKAEQKKVTPLLVDQAMDRPSGDPAMPEDVLLEPCVVTERANAVTALAVSPWAPLVATGGELQVLLHHADTRRLLGVLPFPEGQVRELRFTPNGEYLVAAGGVGGKSGAVAVFAVRSGERVAEWKAFYDEVLTADVSADLHYLAAGGTDRLVKVLDLQSGEVVQKIEKHTDWVTQLAFSPDAVLLATGDRFGAIHMWEVDSGQHFYALNGHEKHITGLSWRRDSNLLASCSDEGSVRLWNMGSGKETRQWTSHDGRILHVAFAPDGRMVTTGKDRIVRLWSPDGKEVASFNGFEDLPLSAAVTADGKQVICGNWNGRVTAHDIAKKTKLGSFDVVPRPLVEQQAAAAAEVVRLRGDWEKARRQVDAKKQQHEELQQLLTEMEQRATGAAVAVQQQQTRVKQVQAEELAMRSLTGAGEAQLAQLEQQIAALQAVIEAPANSNHVEQVHTDRRAKLEELEKAMDSVKADLADRSNRQQEQQQQVRETQEKLQQLQEAQAASLSDLAAKKPQLEAARQAYQSIEAQARKTPELVAAEHQLQGVDAALFNLKVHAARRRQQDHLRRLAQARAEAQQAREEVDALTSEQERQVNELKTLEQEYKKMKDGAAL